MEHIENYEDLYEVDRYYKLTFEDLLKEVLVNSDFKPNIDIQNSIEQFDLTKHKQQIIDNKHLSTLGIYYTYV